VGFGLRFWVRRPLLASVAVAASVEDGSGSSVDDGSIVCAVGLGFGLSEGDGRKEGEEDEDDSDLHGESCRLDTELD